MKPLSTILIVVTLMCLTVLGAHAEVCASVKVGNSIFSVSPEDIFLKGYHAKGDSIWVRIDPPMMQGQSHHLKKDLMGLLKNVIEGYGVTHMAAICAICKSQFTKILPYYGFEMDQIVSVHQLVSNALILTGQVDEDEDETDEEAA